MLPASPKAGKRILLERVRFIWSKLSFNYKATARNLFRYKKHFIMTITGIAGCTALMLTGFGLKDSLNCISDAQYDQLFKYDLTIALKEDASIEEVIERLQERSVDIDRYTGLHTETVNVETKDGPAAINLFCSNKNTLISDFVALRNRKTGKVIPFSSSSVILTEKLAEILGVSSGDTFKVQFKDSTWAELTITGITENYVGSYLYIGYDAYKGAYGNSPSINSIIAATSLNSQQKRDETAEIILSDAAVSGVSFVSQTRNSFENLLSSINYIVAVIIVAAGALAVIVLYNLTNININERKKELATLKVLGFHDWEVGAYIYREIMLLTLIGTLVGLGLGVLLHIFVISRAESTDLMFGRSVKAVSFLLSAAFTLLFSTLVDLIMYKKIMDIEMVDSMKAVD
jgi:putative ABC transport system permease protein